MPDISVIIPVYRAERDLRRCVDSVLAQTYADFDLILVDDASPDGCPAICDAYAEKDRRVHVIHQVNGGPSKARNAGLNYVYQHSPSRFVAFIDSDDCVHPQYLSCLHEAATQFHTKISMCRHKYISMYDKLEDMAPCEERCAAVKDAEELLVTESSSFNYVWGKLFSKDCFRELRFPEDKSFGEDNLVIYKAMFQAGQIAFLENRMYYYFYNADGITKSRWMPNSLQVFEGIREQLKFYRDNGYQRAWKKEMELYVQQYAYQIHRIREDREHLKENKGYLLQLTREMKKLVRDNDMFCLRDNAYWFEALHPTGSHAQHLKKRFAEELRQNGPAGVFRKAAERVGKKK